MEGSKVIEILEVIANANLEWVGMQHRGDDGIIFDDTGRSLISIAAYDLDEQAMQAAIEAGLIKESVSEKRIHLTPTGWRKLKDCRELCWKPIETAPKDGRWIIAGDIRAGCYVVFIASYGMRTSRDRRPCWFISWTDEKVYPTHWLAEFDDIKVCND